MTNISISMSESDTAKPGKPKPGKLRDYFYGWQCRIRQHAVRNEDGRPSAGMQAALDVDGVSKQLGSVVTGLLKRDSATFTAEFRHIVKKTHDPNLRQQSAIKLLSAVYYQHPKEFDDCLTATFTLDSKLARRLVKVQQCKLQFEQHQQKFNLICDVDDLAVDSKAYLSTYWHNRMFNPVMPARITVLRFKPIWKRCFATPEIS